MAFLHGRREGPIQQTATQGERQDRKVNLLQYGRLGIVNIAKSLATGWPEDQLCVVNGGSLAVKRIRLSSMERLLELFFTGPRSQESTFDGR